VEGAKSPKVKLEGRERWLQGHSSNTSGGAHRLVKPTPPQGAPWDRYDPREGHAQGRTRGVVREEGRYTPRVSD